MSPKPLAAPEQEESGRFSSGRKALAHGDFVYREPAPPVFVEARGSTLVDVEGARYLDAEAANGAAGLGYDASLLAEAARRAAPLPGLPSFCESAPRLRVATRLAKWLNEATGQQGRIAFELGGAQGMELALKVARMNAPGAAFAAFEGAYHGRSALTSQLSSSQRYRAILRGDARAQVVRLPYPDCEQCRFGQQPSTCHVECAAFVERLVSQDMCGVLGADGQADVCAFVTEPVLNVGGMVFPDPRYLENTVRLFRERGALIIVDEVFSGFYRTGKPWGFLQYGFVPDIVVISKALTNGLAPMSFVWARDPLLSPERFPAGTHSVTFANNPLSMAIADTVLDRYEAWTNIEADLGALESALRGTLEAVAERTGMVQSLAVRGATGRLTLKRPLAAAIRSAAVRAGREQPVDGFHGLLVASTGMAPNVICIHPPLVFTPDEVRSMGELLTRAFLQVGAAR